MKFSSDLIKSCSERSFGGFGALLLATLLCSGGTAVAAVSVTVGNASVYVGGVATVAVTLSGTGVAGAQADFAFDSTNTPIPPNADGLPDCTSACNKSGRFLYLPLGCAGKTCTTVRAILSSDLSAIPTGATLYTCRITAPSNAATGSYSLVASNVITSSSAGAKLSTSKTNGTVTVTQYVPPPPCGVGFEIALLLPALWLLRRYAAARRSTALLALAVLWAVAQASTARATASCPGDCNNDGMVTVDELVKAVNIDLGSLNLSSCPAADANNDGSVTVDEIIKMVNVALNGCTPLASPGTHALLVNPGDQSLGAYQTPSGDNVLYQGSKDANGVPTAVYSAVVTTSSGALKAIVDFADGQRPTRVRTADGATLNINWSASASQLRVLFSAPDGHSRDYAVPFAHAMPSGGGGAAALAATSGWVQSDVWINRCSMPVNDASVNILATRAVPLPYLGNPAMRYAAQLNGNGVYSAVIPYTQGPTLTGEQVRSFCEGFNTATDGICKFVEGIGQQGTDWICETFQGTPQLAPCIAAFEALELPCAALGVAPEGPDIDVWSCSFYQYLVDTALQSSSLTLQPEVRVPGRSDVFTFPSQPISSPTFHETLPNAITGGQIDVAAGVDGDNDLGAGDAGTAVTCAPNNTPIGIRWHHSVQLPDNFRACTVSGNGNCDPYFGTITQCCDLCPGGCSAAICPGDYFEQTYPGGVFDLTASTLFAITGTNVYPGCF